ncbi:MULTISPECIES: hypothetical protein [unclassified Nonomuraea]|uniref:hypothetical protein n=1 Tax=unclassified Nonomuraea TaxID=2593643 RepID=UPI0033E3BC3D
MSISYAYHRPLPIGGDLAVQSDPGPRPWNAHHVTINAYRRSTAVAIGDGDSLNDHDHASFYARIAAETSAAAAAHSANAAAGVHAARQALAISFAEEADRSSTESGAIVAGLMTAVVTDWLIDLSWTGNALAFALTSDNAVHALVRPNPATWALQPVQHRQVWREHSGPPGDAAEVLDVRRLLLCSDGLALPLRVGEITRIFSREASAPALCAQLVAAANQAGALDNLTVAIIDLPTTPTAAETATEAATSTSRRFLLPVHAIPSPGDHDAGTSRRGVPADAGRSSAPLLHAA